MKKLLILLFAISLLAACSDDGEATENSGEENDDTTEETESETNNSEEEETKKVYQIGETAVITSDLYEFDYEVTVNDFQLTREVDGTKIEDYLSGAREEDRFAVVDVTIKNISDQTYVPNQMFSANFTEMGVEGGDTSNDEFFTVGDEELAPDEELNGHLVYLTDINYADTFVLKYEMTADEETLFELPNPEK
ncbi:DUF4352 domain-containing protein [Oceanobacillus sojae]|uniref:DUF4352 domain-containing protein n=1 Tax=Oceanobacillus sojae TaxID=582851 RepID=UPI0021A60F13|nr:DUF4352 domain-containing protein [Oceanobacillus sojae]MCT1901549.1 DUF4352 domain-containing protein [Oceanobacillus sojae]